MQLTQEMTPQAFLAFQKYFLHGKEPAPSAITTCPLYGQWHNNDELLSYRENTNVNSNLSKGQ